VPVGTRKKIENKKWGEESAKNNHKKSPDEQGLTLIT